MRHSEATILNVSLKAGTNVWHKHEHKPKPNHKDAHTSEISINTRTCAGAGAVFLLNFRRNLD